MVVVENFTVPLKPKTDSELLAHQRSFIAFRHLIVFAAAHVALTLACVALAFIGEAKLVALLLWLAGTLAMLAFLAVHSTTAMEDGAQTQKFKQRV
jgi:hypothetical protein